MTSQDQQQQNKTFVSLREHLLRRHRHNRTQRQRLEQVRSNAGTMRLGRYLRAARVNAGLSRGELAQRTGLPAGTILALEQGLIIAKEIEPVWLARLSRVLDEDTGTFTLLLGSQPAPTAGRRQPLSGLGAWFSIRRLPGPMYGAVPATLLCILLGVALFLGVELPYASSGQRQSLPAHPAEANVPASEINYHLVEPSSIVPEERLSLLRAERIKIATPTGPPAQPAALPNGPVIEHHPVDHAFLLSQLETTLASQVPEEPTIYSDFVLLASSNNQLEGRPNVTNAEFRLENQILVLPKVININSELRQNMVKAEIQL